jgi:hypothetical protein
MKPLTNDALTSINGGDWLDKLCGVAVGAAIVAGAAIATTATGGLAAPVVFAVAYSVGTPACAVGAMT